MRVEDEDYRDEIESEDFRPYEVKLKGRMLLVRWALIRSRTRR